MRAAQRSCRWPVWCPLCRRPSSKRTPSLLGRLADSDEYDSEAESIVMRLSDQSHLASEEELLQIIHEEFVRWFGSDLAGDTERYLGSAARLHRLWGDYLASGS